jgi:hypothetical protein
MSDLWMWRLGDGGSGVGDFKAGWGFCLIGFGIV